jgi:hypothetical protein
MELSPIAYKIAFLGTRWSRFDCCVGPWRDTWVSPSLEPSTRNSPCPSWTGGGFAFRKQSLISSPYRGAVQGRLSPAPDTHVRAVPGNELQFWIYFFDRVHVGEVADYRMRVQRLQRRQSGTDRRTRGCTREMTSSSARYGKCGLDTRISWLKLWPPRGVKEK